MSVSTSEENKVSTIEQNEVATNILTQLHNNFTAEEMLYITVTMLNSILIVEYGNDKERLDQMIDSLPALIRTGKNYKKLSQ